MVRPQTVRSQPKVVKFYITSIVQVNLFFLVDTLVYLYDDSEAMCNGHY